MYQEFRQRRAKFEQDSEQFNERLGAAKAVIDQEYRDLNRKKTEMNQQISHLKTEIENTKKVQTADLADLNERKDGDLQNLRTLLNNTEQYLAQHNHEFIDKERIETEKADLLNKIDEEITLMRRELADREKEKVIETHELNLNISKKIEETKVALQDLKKEQLDTTRR